MLFSHHEIVFFCKIQQFLIEFLLLLGFVGIGPGKLIFFLKRIRRYWDDGLGVYRKLVQNFELIPKQNQSFLIIWACFRGLYITIEYLILLPFIAQSSCLLITGKMIAPLAILQPLSKFVQGPLSIRQQDGGEFRTLFFLFLKIE